MDNFINIQTNMVQYNKEEESKEVLEAFASPSLNPTVRWAKFTLTDDEPNGNYQRIPLEEFENLIRTGKFMPIKVAPGKINEGHANALPIGVITHLRKIKNKIVGLAALWAEERPEDVNMLKEKYDNDEPIDLSWEVGYTDSETDEETGVQTLKNTFLKAVAIVGIPAYGGRTPITAFASEDKTEELKLDELEKVKNELAKKVEDYEALEAKFNDLKTELDSKIAEASTLTTELEELRAFKTEIEDARAELEKRNTIKEKFTEAGIEKPDEYFDENFDKFSKLDEESLEFVIQELVAFSSKKEDTKEEDKDGNASSLPDFKNDDLDTIDTKSIIEYLRNKNKK